MDLPVSLALSRLRIVRLPKRTSRLSSSMTGSIPLFKRRHAPACSHHLIERNRALKVAGKQADDIDSHQVPSTGHADAVGLTVCGDQGGLHVAERGDGVLPA